MAVGLSASIIKGWFQYRCERKVRYECMERADLSAIPVLSDQRENPWAVKGQDFEDDVLKALARHTGVLLPPGRLRHERSLKESIALNFLRGQSPAQYASQLNVTPKTSPYTAPDSEPVKLRDNLTDLVRRESGNEGPVFTLIDIKATRRSTAFHKAQVAFYARLLGQKLAELRVPGRISPRAEIWRFPDSGKNDGSEWGIDEFELKPYDRQVTSFMASTLPRILKTTVNAYQDTTDFHVYFKCEQCKFLPHCLRSVRPEVSGADRDVSAVPGVSHQSKKALNRAGITTVAGLAEAGRAVATTPDAGWGLSRNIDLLIARARALQANTITPLPDAQTFLMPSRTEVQLFLLADTDPVDGNLAALGYLYGDEAGDQIDLQVLETSDKASEAAALLRIFTRFLADLARIDAHNADAERSGSSEKKRAHIFVYEPAEATALQEAVSRHIEHPDIRSGLLNLVRLFPPEEIIPEPEFRGVDHLPATALRSVFEQLYALPVTVSYDLGQVSSVIAQAGQMSTPYVPGEVFERPFSSILALDIVRNLREKRSNAVPVTEIEANIRDRLRAMQGAADWLFQQDDARRRDGTPPLLRLRKKPFRFQESFDPLNARDLEILTALELLESRSAKLETLVRLSKPAQTRRDSGRAIGPLRLKQVEDNGETWVLESADPLDYTELSADSFALILTDGAADNILEASLWDAYSCSIRSVYKRLVYVRVPPRHKWSKDRIELDRIQSMNPDAVWWVDEVYRDVNTPRIHGFLKQLEAGSGAV